MRNPKKIIWIVRGHSESGDDYGPKKYEHKPNRQDLRDFIRETGEELDCDGPGYANSYVHLQIDKI